MPQKKSPKPTTKSPATTTPTTTKSPTTTTTTSKSPIASTKPPQKVNPSPSPETTTKTAAASKMQMMKKSMATTAKEAEEEHVYEKVTVVHFLKRNSWSDRKGNSIGKRWWRRKGRKQQALTLVKVALFFTAVAAIVVTLISVGTYFMVKKIQSMSDLDSSLTTKTTQCRKQYQDKAECVVEDPKQIETCTNNAQLCYLIQREFRQSGEEMSFEKQDSEWYCPIHRMPREGFLKLEKTENADCSKDIEDRKWCIKGACVRSNVPAENWYKSKSFPDDKGSLVVRAIDDLPCLKKQNGSEAAFNNFVSWFVGQCGQSSCDDHCNSSICKKDTSVKYALRVGLFHCDLSLDPVTGARGYPCQQSLIKVYNCGQCTSYDGTTDDSKNRGKVKKELAKKTCKNLQSNVDLESHGGSCSFHCSDSDGVTTKHNFPDGMACRNLGACVMGVCYALDDPKSH